MRRNQTILLLTTIALGAAITAPAYAQCGAGMAPKAAVAWQGLPALALPGPRLEALAATPAPAPHANDPSMVGLWKVAYVSGGQIVDQAFDAWHSDGTETLVDTPPPSTGNVCLGVWAQTGMTYKLNHPSWTFDANGNLNGTAVIKETLTLDSHGNNFMGTFTVDVFDLNGKLLQHLAGTVTGQRITVD